jgi:hypothetical protein
VSYERTCRRANQRDAKTGGHNRRPHGAHTHSADAIAKIGVNDGILSAIMSVMRRGKAHGRGS